MYFLVSCTLVPLPPQNDRLKDDSSGLATDPPAIPPIRVYLQPQTSRAVEEAYRARDMAQGGREHA